MAGFTAERDMGTEGAGSADTAIRDAINSGLIIGPRLRISGNAIDILGGHEDANHFNPAQHVLSNADYANNADEIVAVIRQQHKEGSDFVKIYETGHDTIATGCCTRPINTRPRSSRPRSRRPRAGAAASPCMPWASPERSTRRKPASPPSTMPRS